ncbi:hypothetical protein GDO78_013400 [Eleutherodactylus coqui]|uniref:Uncharacterized protein n=1 Tax=Eleutherodactylus coqui TaxID=57060 RepID=A0A8J6K3Z2_ELECQ|nr:hypothetical protein GDO78_013400 [Eleutherodactylus coqui]
MSVHNIEYLTSWTQYNQSSRIHCLLVLSNNFTSRPITLPRCPIISQLELIMWPSRTHHVSACIIIELANWDCHVATQNPSLIWMHHNRPTQ